MPSDENPVVGCPDCDYQLTIPSNFLGTLYLLTCPDCGRQLTYDVGVDHAE